MEESNIFVNSILAVASLLFLSSVIAASLKKIRLPYTVILTIVGVLLSLLAKNVEIFSFLNVLELSPELIFYIFLPVLIFESAYNIKLLELKDNIVTISILAIVSLSISAFLIGFLLHYFLGFVGIMVPFMITLLFGALISATDPVAVLALFKEIRVPKRLYLLFEGESLFNDGTAVVLFQIIFSSAMLGGISVFSAINGISEFFYMIVVSVIFGAFMGYFFSFVIGKIRNNFTIEITLTLILAHVTFIIAEYFLHVSGIIATVFAGLMIGSYGRSKISPPVRDLMEKFWLYGAFVVNSLIFLLIGLSIKNINFVEFILASFIGIIVVLLARTISVFAVFPFINKFSKEEKTPFKWQIILSWGGLRGALALAIALLLPLDFEFRDFFLTLTLSVIFFTLIVQATSIKALIRKLAVDKISDEESFEIEEGFIFVDETVRKKLREMFDSKIISSDIFKKLDKKYCCLEDDSKNKLVNIIKNHGEGFSHNEMLRMFKRQALGIEKRLLYTLFENFEITENTFNILNAKLDRQINRIQKGQSQLLSEDAKDIELTIGKIKKKILEILKRNGIFTELIKKNEVKEAIIRYKMIRARALIGKNVVKQLEKIVLLNTFADKDALNKVIAQYKNFEHNNLKNMKKLKSKYPELVNLIEYAIANYSSIRLEKSLIFDLNQNGIIENHIYEEVNEYLDELIHKKTNIFKKYLALKKYSKSSLK